ncbi:SUMF1/EgtB/PvdO family nonheme iron enzyme [uncultured Lamprocystis sp.]|jgi:hypothetical protein|uniref:SUMF1/EgtB/PvdO family nonheme iron enzyme n=1 Tax=uncultured Lamprocystis sp. TaxID=543132 RepID=UPI003446397E
MNGSPRVLRGGAFNNEARNLRSTNRNRNEPENRNRNIGFRCVLAARRQPAADTTLALGARQDPAGGTRLRNPLPARSSNPPFTRSGDRPGRPFLMDWRPRLQPDAQRSRRFF